MPSSFFVLEQAQEASMIRRLSPLRFLVILGSLTVVWLAAPIKAGTFAVADRSALLVQTSQIQAAEFLTHASFGATEQEINELATQMRTLGTIAAANAWIDAQFAMPLDDNARHLPLAEFMIAQDASLCTAVNNAGNPIPVTSVQIPNPTRYRQFAWWHRAITNPDQLRQKTAWALYQIFAVGNNFERFNETTLEGTGSSTPPRKSRFLGLSNYYDVFINNAFGTYRNVLGEVTYHAIMGEALSYRGNQKASGGSVPDDSYAREGMQLFTIGPYKLNDDGVQQLDANGAPIPTFDQDDVSEYAQVFTGLGYNGTGGTTGTGAAQISPFFQRPMTMQNSAHDTSSKELLHGTIPALPTSPTRAQCLEDIDTALTGLTDQNENPPFICRLLIQRFVKSNPSRAYLNRVVQIYKNNGSNVRGDLKAVIRAILTDSEAWQPIRTQLVRNPNRILVTTMGTEDSRLQEPVVNYTRFIRFFKGAARYEAGATAINTQGTAVLTVYDTTGTPLSNEFRLGSRFHEFEQSPYESHAVLSFYDSNYQPAGDILNTYPSSRIPNRSLNAPEFQIANAVSSNRTVNFYHSVIRAGLQVELHLPGGSFAFGTPPSVVPATSTNTAGDRTTINTPTRCRVVYDASPSGSPFYPSFHRQSVLASAIPIATTDGATPLVEHLDLYLCGGTLNLGYRAKLIAVLSNMRTTLEGGTGGYTATDANTVAKAAIFNIVNSPSFLVTE
jgi:uncharacterized protein (DUF1800 family)